jgi:2-oxoglutarate/2-oxoacid ferredoxin oxidoreductase subunit alpha
MKLNILIGGEAGQGPNILSKVIGETFFNLGYYVFYSRDYQSRIRGGHNFNLITISDIPVFSNESGLDFIISLDEATRKIHSKNLNKGGIIISGHKENMEAAGAFFRIINFNFSLLEKELQKLSRFEENIKYAKIGFEKEEQKSNFNIKKVNNKSRLFLSGTNGVAESALKSGMEIYYAYPMTPATPLLSEFASLQKNKKFLVVELENEISVINAALGSSIVGKSAMVGTSGGGFDLMTEGLSMATQAEIPMVIYLATRPGPGTGVATYTSQGDLNLARHSGHGESFRIVLAPGTPEEAIELTSQAFYLSNKFNFPAIVLSDKHFAESFYTIEKDFKILVSKNNSKLKKYNSYESDENGIATETSEIIKRNFEKRLVKWKNIEKEAKKFKQYKVYGNKKSENVLVSYGSPKGAILDAINNLDIKFVQILYIEPFPEGVVKELGGNIILVENSSTAQLADLIREKTGIKIENKNRILRYDGRPFFSDELMKEIKMRCER